MLCFYTQCYSPVCSHCLSFYSSIPSLIISNILRVVSYISLTATSFCLLRGLLPLYIQIASGLTFIFSLPSLIYFCISSSRSLSLKKNVRNKNKFSQHTFYFWVSQCSTLRDFKLILAVVSEVNSSLEHA